MLRPLQQGKGSPSSRPMIAPPSPLQPAVFFDRDGVVNVSPGEGYVLREEDFHLSPGIVEALALCKQRGFQLILVTSQQGVGKGLMSQATLDAIHAGMQHTLAAAAAAFNGIYSCTHLSGSCTCRKPSPEMIFRAQQDHQLDLTQSWLVGDHDRDIQMAKNAGVHSTIRILSHHEPGVTATHTLASTIELAALLDRVLPHARG
jgi:histidinol-phosphate phosphatase family protein